MSSVRPESWKVIFLGRPPRPFLGCCNRKYELRMVMNVPSLSTSRSLCPAPSSRSPFTSASVRSAPGAVIPGSMHTSSGVPDESSTADGAVATGSPDGPSSTSRPLANSAACGALNRWDTMPWNNSDVPFCTRTTGAENAVETVTARSERTCFMIRSSD